MKLHVTVSRDKECDMTIMRSMMSRTPCYYIHPPCCHECPLDPAVKFIEFSYLLYQSLSRRITVLVLYTVTTVISTLVLLYIPRSPLFCIFSTVFWQAPACLLSRKTLQRAMQQERVCHTSNGYKASDHLQCAHVLSQFVTEPLSKGVQSR